MKALDDALRLYFPHRPIALRCIDSKHEQHGGISRHDLVNIIIKTGTDRHDTNQKSMDYEALKEQGKEGDLCCYVCDLSSPNSVMATPVNDFCGGAISERGEIVYFDIISIYNPALLEKVDYKLSLGGRGFDTFKFRDKDKVGALMGVLEITE